MSLSQETIVSIKETIPLINQEAENITIRMYEILFSKYPETKPLFDNASTDQHKKLAGAIAAFAANIDNLGALSKAVEKMSQVHVKAKVQPSHYPMVADSLITAIGDILGDKFSDKYKDAWVEAYTFLANILIQREKILYEQTGT